MKPQPRIIFWGTPDFAIPPLEALINNGYDVIAVITNPDEPVGREQILTASPVKIFAQKHGILVLQPEKLEVKTSLRTSEFSGKGGKFEIPEADLYVVVAYGKIIPKEILEKPQYGILNLHPSLLPRWRGPSPIRYAMLSGDTKTGVTVIQMDEGMDHGPILAQAEFEIPEKVSYVKLRDALIKAGSELLIQTIPQWISREITPEYQNDAKVTYSKILTKNDGRIDWTQPAEKIERMVRAFNPWPGTWTMWLEEKKRIQLNEVDVSSEFVPNANPGQVWKTTEGGIFIQTAKGSIVVKLLTLEGKKTMDAASFARGYPTIEKSTLA
jgi:methionyl-tRNA formyltransferase